MERQYVTDLVSVVTPVYNAGKVIDKTLESIFNQTYKKIEIVLVDDCSKDNSREVIEKYKEKHPEILYYCQETNQGAGAARNKALELAKGQYVAFLDADDMWHPEKIEKQINLLKKKNGAFSYTAIQMVDENDNVVKTKRKVKEQVDYNFLLHNTMIATSTVVVDRTKLGDFRMPLRRGGQDYATWLMLLRDGTIAYGINEALEDYRVGNKDSLASKKGKSVRQVWEIQTQDEGISKIVAVFNIFCFCVNAAKKYLI
ncbi:glycosyltransferase family 2 protein [Blautia schinkii]|nr:glycosyltransferase family 2 protein [Blautia schinkii]